MGKTDSLQQAIVYNTIHDLTQELIRQGDDPEIRQLSESLLGILQKARGPVTREQAVTQAITTIASVPSADRQFRAALTENRTLVWSEKGYLPAPGKQQVIRPGPLLVCPVVGCHYEQFLMQKGEEYTCPAHKVALVPKPTGKRGKQT